MGKTFGSFFIIGIVVLFLFGCSDKEMIDMICSDKDKNLAMKAFCFFQSKSGSEASTEEKKGECLYDSECPPTCEGDVAWKRGCNPRIGKCENLDDTNCAESETSYGEYTFKAICEAGQCRYNTNAMTAKRAEIKQEIVDLTARQRVYGDILKKATQACNMKSGTAEQKAELLSAPRIQMPTAEDKDSLPEEVVNKIDSGQYRDNAEYLISDYCKIAEAMPYYIEWNANSIKEKQAASDEIYDFVKVIQN